VKSSIEKNTDKITGMDKTVDALKAGTETKKEKIKGQWQLYAALGTGALALIGTLIMLLVTYLGQS